MIFTSPARSDLEHIPPRIVAAIIEFVFGDLARAPRRVGKPLRQQLESSYSARRGPYRILYKINDPAEQIEIVRIDHRANVYRNA